MPGEWTTYKGQPLNPDCIANSAAQGEQIKQYLTDKLNSMLKR